MVDLFEGKAEDYDSRPIPAQISDGVFGAMKGAVQFSRDLKVMDFGAGTGLVSSKIAPLVGQILAVDVSQAMLEKLAEKPELKGKVEIHCQNILNTPLEEKADLVVSAMAMHHVEDTHALLQTLFEHLKPGGQVALADLDKEDGDFHPEGVEGVYHSGFEREALSSLIKQVGLVNPTFVNACAVNRDGKDYPIFLVTASKPR